MDSNGIGSSSSLPSLKCIAIVLCESVARIADGGDLVIFRTFHSITARVMPHRHPRMTVLCTMTGGHGKYPIELAIVNERAAMDVAVGRSTLTAEDPLKMGDLIIHFHDTLLPEPGKYWIELRCNGEIIAQRPFNLYFKPPTPGSRTAQQATM